MPPQLVIVRAKFDGRGFIVIDRSPDLPELSGDPGLLRYLNMLSTLGWNAVQGRFDGWEVILEVEHQTEAPYKIGSAYMIPMLHQSSCPEGLTATAAQQAQLIHHLEEIGEKEGWQILAGAKQFAVDGLKTVSIWVKTYPLP